MMHVVGSWSVGHWTQTHYTQLYSPLPRVGWLVVCCHDDGHRGLKGELEDLIELHQGCKGQSRSRSGP